MGKRVLLAGASGVIGRRLVPQLLQAGHAVVGLARSDASALRLQNLGVSPVMGDVFEREGLFVAFRDARVDVVIHQLTDLSLLASDPAKAGEASRRNARIRTAGTRNLVDAAMAAGVTRVIAQSITWAYADGPKPFDEAAPLDTSAPPPRSITVSGVVALEDAVLRTTGLRGTVLRYGQLYGPGTASELASGASPVHVDAAAHAALLALERDAAGVFNVADANSTVATGRAGEVLGWSAAYRLPVPVAGVDRAQGR